MGLASLWRSVAFRCAPSEMLIHTGLYHVQLNSAQACTVWQALLWKALQCDLPTTRASYLQPLAFEIAIAPKHLVRLLGGPARCASPNFECGGGL